LIDFSDDLLSLSDALQANNHASTIFLDFCGLGRSNVNWESLLRVIALRENLEKVGLGDTFDAGQRNPPDRITPFLLAIQQNPRVKIVGLYCLQLSGISLASFLDGARSVTELQLFRCDMEASADALAIGAALQRNTTIQRLELKWLDEDFMLPVLNSLTSEHSKSKLESFVLKGFVHQRRRETFHAAISLLQPHSLLRSLQLDNYGYFPTPAPEASQDFARLLTAVEASPLESFSLGTISLRERCLALITSIPKMQVGTLKVHLDPDNLDFDDRDLKNDFIGAVKRNASLHTVLAGAEYGEGWFDEDDARKLISYLARNKFLAQWIENPTAVFKVAWPVALDVAQTTGPDTVFRILCALAPTFGTI
jgi:hypothetical protein